MHVLGWVSCLVPLVVDLLLAIDVTAQEVPVGTEECNGGVLLMNKDVGAIRGLEDPMLLEVGCIVLGVVLPPLVALWFGG